MALIMPQLNEPLLWFWSIEMHLPFLRSSSPGRVTLHASGIWKSCMRCFHVRNFLSKLRGLSHTWGVSMYTQGWVRIRWIFYCALFSCLSMSNLVLCRPTCFCTKIFHALNYQYFDLQTVILVRILDLTTQPKENFYIRINTEESLAVLISHTIDSHLPSTDTGEVILLSWTYSAHIHVLDYMQTN